MKGVSGCFSSARFTAFLVIFLLLAACDKPDEFAERLNGDDINGVEQPPTADGPRDLKLEYVPDRALTTPASTEIENFDEAEQRAVQLDNLFDQQEKQQRLKINSKLRVKEGADLDSVRQDYRDSIDGGEVSVEYQTP